MDLRALRYFVAVAQAGSFSAGAARLYVAQSALSRHIKTLEEELGGDLFVRVPRGVELTEAGSLLLKRAACILNDVFTTQQDLLTHHGELRGVASLIAPSSLGECLFVPLVDHFSRNFPKVQLRLSEGLSREAADRLSQGEVEVAIVTEPSAGDHLDLELLFEEQMLFVAPKGTHRVKKKMTLQEAARFPLIVPSRFKWPKQLEAALLSPGAREPAIQVDSHFPTLKMVRSGRGCAVLSSCAMASGEFRDLVVSRVVDYSVKRWVAVSRARPVSRASSELISVLRSEAKTLEARGLISRPR